MSQLAEIHGIARVYRMQVEGCYHLVTMAEPTKLRSSQSYYILICLFMDQGRFSRSSHSLSIGSGEKKNCHCTLNIEPRDKQNKTKQNGFYLPYPARIRDAGNITVS